MNKQQIQKDLKNILSKHFSSEDKLELNKPYLVLFQELTEYILMVDKCRVCKKYTGGNKTCSSKCLAELRSQTSSRLVKQGVIPKIEDKK